MLMHITSVRIKTLLIRVNASICNTPSGNYQTSIACKTRKKQMTAFNEIFTSYSNSVSFFFLLVDTVVEDHSPHGMGGKSNYYQIITKKISTYVLKSKSILRNQIKYIFNVSAVHMGPNIIIIH